MYEVTKLYKLVWYSFEEYCKSLEDFCVKNNILYTKGSIDEDYMSADEYSVILTQKERDKLYEQHSQDIDLEVKVLNKITLNPHDDCDGYDVVWLEGANADWAGSVPGGTENLECIVDNETLARFVNWKIAGDKFSQ